MTESGKRILLTDGHPVMTERGWIRAGNLCAADKVVTADGRTEALQGLFLTTYNDMVFNIEVEGEVHQLIAEGILVGDFICQNQPREEEKESITLTGEQEVLASEFQTLMEEIRRVRKW